MVLLACFLKMAEQGPHDKNHAGVSDCFVLEAGLHLKHGSKEPRKHRKQKEGKRLNWIPQALIVAGPEL